MQISNAKEIILNHEAEWKRIMTDENDKQNLMRYGMMMITIAYIVLFVLSLIFRMGMGVFGGYSSMYVITSVVIRYVLSIASLYFVPMILAALAPSFGGKNDQMSALKLYVFAATPAWLGTSISAIPVIGWLVALAGGIYAIYLFWQHVADAMTVPAEKKVGYVIVSVIVLAVIYWVIGLIGAGIAFSVSPYSLHAVGY
jgi:hypothetical protein